MYSDMFAVHVGDGFGIYAAVRTSSLGTAYNQTIGSLNEAGTITFAPILTNSTSNERAGDSIGIRPIEFDLYHGIYEEFWPSDGGVARISATVWVGYPYAKFVASFGPATSGHISGRYSMRWLSLSDSEPGYFLLPAAKGYNIVKASGHDRIDFLPNSLDDNFIAVWGGKFGVELIIFEKRPTSLIFDPTHKELQINYSVSDVNPKELVKIPPIYVGFLRTTDSGASPTREEIATAQRLAHSTLAFPTSLRIFYTVKQDSVEIRDKYSFDYLSANDWGIPSQPIAPLRYETNATAPIDFTLQSVWAPISYVSVNSDDELTFSLKLTIPAFELPTGTNPLVDGSPEARAIYSSIDNIENAQKAVGEWDGNAYHDGRVVTHLLLIYPVLNPQYRAKVAKIAGKTLSNYYTAGIVYNPATNAYRFNDIEKKRWESAVDLGALTAWLFYATALYTRYVDPAFTKDSFNSLRKIERTVERVVDWSGLSWANPDPDTNGELLIETAMTFLVYYHLASQDSNIQEMDRAAYFASLTENFLLRVFEQPHRYWARPNLVGQFTPGRVFDHVDSPPVQWNWANVIWGMWTPVMAHSYTRQYIDGVKQTAVQDWQWNDPKSPKFDVEYLNFNMILLYMHEPEAKENAQIILSWFLANKTGRYYQTALSRAEQAAQIGYTMLTNNDDKNEAMSSTAEEEYYSIFLTSTMNHVWNLTGSMAVSVARTNVRPSYAISFYSCACEPGRERPATSRS